MHAFDNWYPIALSKDIQPFKIYTFQLFNEPLVLYRDNNNRIVCLQDRCAHRSTPLSLGRVVNGLIECRYHGWQFDHSGCCKRIPTLNNTKHIPQKACVPCKKTLEKHQLIWIYHGQATNETPYFTYSDIYNIPDKSYRFNFSIDLDLPYELMIENLLDPSHLPFAHHGTLSRRNKAGPIDFEVTSSHDRISGTATIAGQQTKKTFFHFIAPHTVYFDADFGSRGMCQVHHCIPLTPQRMRLISSFYYKNMPWLRWLPFRHSLQTYMSHKIVRQDVSMLTGQNKNICIGAKPWNTAVGADKMAYAYRQWLNTELAAHSPWFKCFNDYPSSPIKKENNHDK